jgi:hypothetical protein
LDQPYFLFPYAEAAEDAVEDVVGVNRTDDTAEFIKGEADFSCDEFFSGRLPMQCSGVLERFSRGLQRFPAPLCRSRDDFAFGSVERENFIPQLST